MAAAGLRAVGVHLMAVWDTPGCGPAVHLAVAGLQCPLYLSHTWENPAPLPPWEVPSRCFLLPSLWVPGECPLLPSPGRARPTPCSSLPLAPIQLSLCPVTQLPHPEGPDSRRSSCGWSHNTSCLCDILQRAVKGFLVERSFATCIFDATCPFLICGPGDRVPGWGLLIPRCGTGLLSLPMHTRSVPFFI